MEIGVQVVRISLAKLPNLLAKSNKAACNTIQVTYKVAYTIQKNKLVCDLLVPQDL